MPSSRRPFAFCGSTDGLHARQRGSRRWPASRSARFTSIFPNRNAIAVEIIRQRTRSYLAAVLAADLTTAATPEEAVDGAIAAFVIEKRKGLDVSLALRDALPEVQGRQTIIAEARGFVPALQAKLAAAGAGTAEAMRLAVALAAVEGAVWEMIEQDQAAIERPEAIASLSRVFRAAAGFSPAAAAR